MKPIEYYLEQESLFPFYSATLVVRKLLILEELFKNRPEIIIKNKYFLNFEFNEGIGLDYDFKNNIIINTPQNDENPSTINSLILELKRTDDEFMETINKELDTNRLSYLKKDEDGELYDYYNNMIKSFFLFGEPVNYQNRIDRYEDFFTVTGYTDFNDFFVGVYDMIINKKEYKENIIDFYGEERHALPFTKKDTYNYIYYNNYACKNEYLKRYIKDILLDFIGIINDKVNNNYIFQVQFENKKIKFFLKNDEEHTIEEKSYPIYTNSSYKDKSHDIKCAVKINCINDIFTSPDITVYGHPYIISFILSNVMETRYGKDSSPLSHKQFEHEMIILLERSLINQNLDDIEQKSHINKKRI